MAPPPLDVRDLARRVVVHEMTGADCSPAEAVERACRALSQELAKGLGRGGVAALMGRALNLARREHPELADVTLGPAGSFEGAAAALDRAEDRGLTAGAGILAHLFELLSLLLGEALGLQSIRRLWPHLLHSIEEIGE